MFGCLKRGPQFLHRAGLKRVRYIGKGSDGPDLMLGSSLNTKTGYVVFAGPDCACCRTRSKSSTLVAIATFSDSVPPGIGIVTRAWASRARVFARRAPRR